VDEYYSLQEFFFSGTTQRTSAAFVLNQLCCAHFVELLVACISGVDKFLKTLAKLASRPEFSLAKSENS
jgi:hypothetical protein